MSGLTQFLLGSIFALLCWRVLTLMFTLQAVTRRLEVLEDRSLREAGRPERLLDGVLRGADKAALADAQQPPRQIIHYLRRGLKAPVYVPAHYEGDYRK